MSHAFSRGNVVAPPNPDDPPQEMNGRFGVFEEGRLCASLTIAPFLVHWEQSQTLAMGGIAGVATFADARGRGYVNQLLVRSLEAMREAGQTISALYPFAWAFYRRFGWEWVGEKRNVEIPLTELRAHSEGRAVRDVTGETAREILEPGYTAFARQYRGVFTTESHRWNRSLAHDDNRTTHVYQHGPTDSYLLWRYDRNGDGGEVREFVADTPEGYRALLSLLHYFGTQCKTARMTVPADSPLWFHTMHWDLDTTLEPVFMGRIVDFGAAIQHLKLPADTLNGSLTLTLHDEHAPWNHGTWRITVEAGNVLASTVVGASDSADVSADIQALSQAFWGTPSLETLRRAGRLTVANEAGYELLSRVLPSVPVYTLDHF
jgi:predicted acetyltransferase